jgi:phosphatidylglycerol:prolipoprotein diacylglycerol transferase
MVWLDSIAAIFIDWASDSPAGQFHQSRTLWSAYNAAVGHSDDAAHRLPQWSDLTQYPLETTRFHPTFAYEMVWNFAAAGLLIWLPRRFEKKLQPGTIFFGWLMLAGIGRAIIETWRPDQPVIAGLGISISRLVALMMALLGVVLMLWRYKPLGSTEK